MAQVGYCFRSAASSSSAACASGLSSSLSRAKNAGLSGEFRLRSSSDADAMASSEPARAARSVGSATGSGGAGGARWQRRSRRWRRGRRRPDHRRRVLAASDGRQQRQCSGGLRGPGSPSRASSMLPSHFDQSGYWLLPALVICRRFLPSRAIVKICDLPARVDMNARCRPLGAQRRALVGALAERQLPHLRGSPGRRP